LNNAAIQDLQIENDYIFARMNVSVAENLLQVKYHYYVHKTKKQFGRIIRSEDIYSVPSFVAEHLDFIGGVNHFPKPMTTKIASNEKYSLKSNLTQLAGWTPRYLRNLFRTSDASPKSNKNRQAAASFLGQYFDEVDLQEFFVLLYQEGIGSMPSKVVGDQGLFPGIEANLDVQYIMATSDLVDTWVYSVDGLHQEQEPFLKWAVLVSKESDSEVPKTISISYGDDENSITNSYAVRVCNEFVKMGLRGISVMFASGDSGTDCESDGTQFLPGWPATCPYVTAVGGVQGDESGGSSLEGDYISGGGFSNIFTMPSYQKSAVQKYLQIAKKSYLPPQSFWNSTGRCFPDVAAPSEGFWVTMYGIPTPVAGTSCASPSFTTVISLLNDLQLQKNKKTLGFLNPWLYSLPKGVLQSVYKGCNAGCTQNNGLGFCAVEGSEYSPVSGLGVPDYSKMIKYLP